MYITPHNWHYIGQPMIDWLIYPRQQKRAIIVQKLLLWYFYISLFLSIILSFYPSFLFLYFETSSNPPPPKKRWLKCLNLLISLNKRKEILIGLDLTPVFVPVRYSDLLRQETNGYLSKPKQSKKKLAQFVLPLFLYNDFW